MSFTKAIFEQDCLNIFFSASISPNCTMYPKKSLSDKQKFSENISKNPPVVRGCVCVGVWVCGGGCVGGVVWVAHGLK